MGEPRPPQLGRQSLEEQEPLKARIVCAWCQKEMGVVEGEGITHSICQECSAKIYKELEESGPGEK